MSHSLHVSALTRLVLVPTSACSAALSGCCPCPDLSSQAAVTADFFCAARQLSGGERRRIALALLLGFADLISARGRLQCNIIVLDEVWPMYHDVQHEYDPTQLLCKSKRQRLPVLICCSLEPLYRPSRIRQY